MDAAIVSGEVQVRLQERAVGLVELACFNNLFADRVLVRIQKALCEAWQAVGSPWVGDAKFVKPRRDAGCGPRVFSLPR